MDEEQPDQKYHQLAEKWMNGSITPEEQADFAQWYADGQANPVEVNSAFAADELSQRNRMLAKMPWTEVKKPGRMKKMYAWTAAAAILLVMGAALLLWVNTNGPVKCAAYANDINPGKNQAVLVLANGKRLALDQTASATLSQQTGVKIIKNQAGQIVYQYNESSTSEVTEHTIETPLGGQYQVVLPDDSRVWLNAGSAITFPTSFAASFQRIVTLRGEAYFEISHDAKKPFIVQTAQQQIKVLGTHFNVKAYADEPAIKTTLLEGSVAVNDNTILKPGEQAINNGKDITVMPVNTDYAVAWTNGKFRFHNTHITDLMKDVARWYNVQVIYEDNMENKDFSGVVSRFDNVSKLLSVLESTNTIHFKIEGRRILVMK